MYTTLLLNLYFYLVDIDLSAAPLSQWTLPVFATVASVVLILIVVLVIIMVIVCRQKECYSKVGFGAYLSLPLSLSHFPSFSLSLSLSLSHAHTHTHTITTSTNSHTLMHINKIAYMFTHTQSEDELDNYPQPIDLPVTTQLLPRATQFDNPPIGSGRFSMVYKQMVARDIRAVKVC